MSYIDKPSGQYPVSEREIRALYPTRSWPTPFKEPPEYAWVFPTPQPTFDAITHVVREVAPALSTKGQYEQQWEVYALGAETVEANIKAAKERLTDAATAKRWEVETGGMTLPGGVHIATGTEDQNRITSVIANAQRAGVETVDFKAASGWLTLTLAEVQGIASAIALHVQACFSAERAHHEAISLLTTAKGVTDYDLNAGWPSNTGGV